MKVIWTKRAARSLSLIADYIAKDSEQAAYETVVRIRSATNQLAEHSELGRPGRVTGTRELVVTPSYIVPYRIKKREIHVLHVFHANRRWPDDF